MAAPGWLLIWPDGTPVADSYGTPLLFRTREDALACRATLPVDGTFDSCRTVALVRWNKPRTNR